MDDKSKFRQHVNAFLSTHQIGEDPDKYIAKLTQITISDPASWDGKLPQARFHPDQSHCKVVVSSKARPIIP